MLVLEVAIVATAAMSIIGFLRAQHLHREELSGLEDVDQREILLPREMSAPSYEASPSLVDDDDAETSWRS